LEEAEGGEFLNAEIAEIAEILNTEITESTEEHSMLLRPGCNPFDWPPRAARG
jgi:hypothetical protein